MVGWFGLAGAELFFWPGGAELLIWPSGGLVVDLAWGGRVVDLALQGPGCWFLPKSRRSYHPEKLRVNTQLCGGLELGLMLRPLEHGRSGIRTHASRLNQDPCRSFDFPRVFSENLSLNHKRIFSVVR